MILVELEVGLWLQILLFISMHFSFLSVLVHRFVLLFVLAHWAWNVSKSPMVVNHSLQPFRKWGQSDFPTIWHLHVLLSVLGLFLFWLQEKSHWGFMYIAKLLKELTWKLNLQKCFPMNCNQWENCWCIRAVVFPKHM